MERIRTVIWDLDETVWFHLKDQGKILANLIGIKEKGKFAHQYSQMWKEFLPKFQNEKVTYLQVGQYMEEKIPILRTNHLSGTDFLEKMQRGKKQLEEVNQEAVEILQYLTPKGYEQISITDWFAAHQEKTLEDLGMRDYIEEVYGCDDGYMKNNPDKIGQVIAELGLEKRREEFIMIGDSLSSDIQFANALGIKSIWYNRKGLVNTTSYIPTLEVPSLLELKNIF